MRRSRRSARPRFAWSSTARRKSSCRRGTGVTTDPRTGESSLARGRGRGFPRLSWHCGAPYGLPWERCVFPTVREVVRALVLYTDWWQPETASVLQVGRRRGGFDDGVRDAHLDSVGVRAELGRRVRRLEPRDRMILFLWYL